MKFVMVNGLPGNVATLVAKAVEESSDFDLCPYSLTGPDVSKHSVEIAGRDISLHKPKERDMLILPAHTFCIDFTEPDAKEGNVRWYCERKLPFVMGTTGGDNEKCAHMVEEAGIAAVIAPNMSSQIVAFQAAIKHMQENFPNLFKGFQLKIQESHQEGKKDTSGTAKAVSANLAAMGARYVQKDDLTMIRKPKNQIAMGIPEEHLGGHGFHTYVLKNASGTVHVEFIHNVLGRETYVDGTMRALNFLANEVDKGSTGCFSMIDVLKG